MSVLRRPASWLESIPGWFYFPQARDQDWERRKVDFARIVLGIILLWRQSGITLTALYFWEPGSFGVPTPFLWSVFYTLLILAFTAGFLTPWICLFLGVTYAYYSMYVMTFNLGPLFATALFLAMVALSAGQVCSVDALLRQSRSRGLAPLRGLLALSDRLVPRPTATQYTVIYFTLFLIYAGNSLEAIALHMKDPYWSRGQTAIFLMSNSFFCRYFDLGRWLLTHAPGFLEQFSATSAILQSAFQLLMIPLLFFRWGSWFVFLYGWAFILFSMVFIQISVLPWVEAVYWYLIFCNSPLRPVLPKRLNFTSRIPTPSSPVYWTYVGFYAVVLGIFFGRVFGNHVIHKAPFSWFPNFAIYVGLWPPNVFNAQDLISGDHWRVMYRIGRGGARELVPMTGLRGERLSYHMSDVLYYGNTLVWRRNMIGKTRELASLHEPDQYFYQMTQRMARFDYRWNQLQGPVLYEIDIFAHEGAQRRNLSDPMEAFEPKRIAQFEFVIGDSDKSDSQSPH